MDGTPGGPRPAMGDQPTAMSLFGAIMLGLYQRERTGRGLKVGTSLIASGAWANACDLQAEFCNATFPERGADGTPPNPLAAGYRSRDGKAFLVVLLDPDKEFPNLCTALDQAELATSPLFADNAARTEKCGGAVRHSPRPVRITGSRRMARAVQTVRHQMGRPCPCAQTWSQIHRCAQLVLLLIWIIPDTASSRPSTVPFLPQTAKSERRPRHPSWALIPVRYCAIWDMTKRP